MPEHRERISPQKQESFERGLETDIARSAESAEVKPASVKLPKSELAETIELHPAEQGYEAPAGIEKRIREIIQENVGASFQRLPPALQEKAREAGLSVIERLKNILMSASPKEEELFKELETWYQNFSKNPFWRETEARNKTNEILSLKDSV